MPKNTIFASLKHNMETDVRIFSGSATNTLAEQIAKSYGKDLGKMSHYRFSDGEIQGVLR
jgi:phosphoribosylpyrophosphate synthetase